MLVPEFLEDHLVSFETVVHPPAFTAQKRARFLHCPGRAVVKSVLLKCASKFLLAVLPATEQVDFAAISRELGEPTRLADMDEHADVFLDCERGAGTPFGSLYGVATLLETSIDPKSWILFESQRHAVAIRMLCSDYEKLERPRRMRFAARTVRL